MYSKGIGAVDIGVEVVETGAIENVAVGVRGTVGGGMGAAGIAEAMTAVASTRNMKQRFTR